MRISPIVEKFNFGGGSWGGVFLDFDDTLWSKSSIYTICVPLGPNVDTTDTIILNLGKTVTRQNVVEIIPNMWECG